MKRVVLAASLLVSFAAALFAQTETSQMVFPKRIYVGDVAELRYNFQSNVDFFPNEEHLTEKTLYLSQLPFAFDNDDFTLSKAVIQKNGVQYTVVFTFEAWNVGQIDFPAFDLLSAVFGNSSTVPFMIDPAPVEVVSILPKGEDTTLRGIAGPLLVPGTIYAVYGAIVFFIGILIFVIYTVVKWQDISAKMEAKKILRLYAKNARGALRQFRKLEKNSAKINDASFCMALQKIFRFYLTTRFGRHFDTLSTDQIMPAFDEIYSGTMSDFLQETVASVVAIFHRSDYIRFAQGSLDSKRLPADKYATVLQQDERSTLIASSRNIIKAFETGDENA